MSLEILNNLHALVDRIVAYVPEILKSIVVLTIGFWFIRRIDKILIKYFERREYDISLEGFIRSLVNVGLKVLVLITVAGMLGLPTASLVAVFGAAGLAIGLALQGSLSNFAGGVLILVFKPFKVGDIITSQGETGVVKEIQIFNTIIITLDNKTVILPNGSVSNGTITNISRQGSLRVEIKLAIDFAEDIQKVRNVILTVLAEDKKILRAPAPTVNILEYGENAMILAVRPYATPETYWDVHFEAYERIHKALIANGIKLQQIKRTMVPA